MMGVFVCVRVCVYVCCVCVCAMCVCVCVCVCVCDNDEHNKYNTNLDRFNYLPTESKPAIALAKLAKLLAKLAEPLD
jgi:hypothetical protein